MFNFKKIKEAVTKMTSVILTASLSLGIFSAVPVNAMGSSNEKSVYFIILGNENSGKTNIMERMVNNEFKEIYNATIGVDFFKKTCNFNSNQYDVKIWDASGQEMFESFIPTFIKDAIILAVSYDCREYSKSIEKWLNFAEKALKERNSRKKIPVKPVKVVLTKSDLNEEERKFTKENVEEYLKNNTGTYQNLKIDKTVIETSAKEDTGINHKESKKRDPKTCLEDYLLDLLEIPEQTQDNPKQIQYNQKQQEHKSALKKAVGVMTKHPVISCTIGALVTGIVVTPLVIFRNKIIKGIESIFGKKQIKKPTAKRIKITN